MIYYLTPEQWDRIPSDYRVEFTDGRPRACFICFLTKAFNGAGTTLCMEGKHFIVGQHREFTETQRLNGGHAVACLQSQQAKDFYNTGLVEVWEYQTKHMQPDGHFSLYAYQYGEEYGEDLTEAELEEKLDGLAYYYNIMC